MLDDLVDDLVRLGDQRHRVRCIGSIEGIGDFPQPTQARLQFLMFLAESQGRLNARCTSANLSCRNRRRLRATRQRDSYSSG